MNPLGNNRFINKRSLFCAVSLAVFLQVLPATAQVINEKDYIEANKALKDSLELGRVSTGKITGALVSGDYGYVEKNILDLENKYLAESRYESPYNKIFDAFTDKNADLRPHLDAWVAKNRNHMSLTARASYYASLGYRVRGGGYISTVPQENIVQMKKYLALSKNDLQEAIKINPQMMPAYTQLIYVEKYLGDRKEAGRILDIAVRNNPENYYPRVAYMSSLVPVWGGSYEEMQSFIDETIKLNPENPRIYSLQGEVQAEKALRAYKEGNCAEAIKYYTGALEYGDRVSWLKARAKCFIETNRKEQAIPDLEKVHFYDPDDMDVIKQLNESRSA